MKIKVISDGTSLGTKIVDEETGNKIINCQSLDIRINGKTRFALCTLTLFDVPVEYIGKYKTISLPTPQSQSHLLFGLKWLNPYYLVFQNHRLLK